METVAAPERTESLDAMALARATGGREVRRLLAIQLARTVFRLGFSGSVAIVVGDLVMQQPVEAWLLATTALSLAFSLGAGFAGERMQAAAETRVADTLRIAAMDRLGDLPVRDVQAIPVGSLVAGAQRYPGAIAGLVIGHRVASSMMVAGPLAAAAMLFLVSWQAALLVLCLTPIMIVFFALVGDAIRRRADGQERAFGRLAGQFADRVRALPTILANHALGTEKQKLTGRLEAYSANTMGVLRIAFLNAAIIDFFASLSIAMLAVFLGLGHLKLAMIPGFSNLELWQSLFILMVAPDYFAPFRRFSEQYHAKAEGEAAAAALDRLLAGNYTPAASVPALDGLKMVLPAAGLVVVTGPSGSGKSTLLRRMAALDADNAGLSAQIAGREISWISTDAYIRAGTLGEVITGRNKPCMTRLILAAAGVGLLDDTLLPGGLQARIADGGANLSGGQRLRIAVARAMLLGGVVIADEPTAKLDGKTAEMVRRAIRTMARRRLVVVATHDPALAALADRNTDLAAARSFGAAA
ncbi:ABC transporter transmembrane domain-containing protein [Mesorhizobium sp. ASY16-5R]|uniref:ABC transporter transmembrane domain-containing protein n=1 Tax=Mesorhizobium sp. ASY16-5R TaxID=3445772 RepID=UPI003F9F5FD8